tara:strand:- start:495 stop:1724 length:1230 start_codon:yes stop_codon:yes gene_type:complete
MNFIKYLLSVTLLFSAYFYSHGTVRGFIDHEPVVINFPDTENYQVYTVDLHTHSVFSDGHVWPTVRVGEAEHEGIDLIAITEHLEYQPYGMDIPHPDRNRSYEIARGSTETDLLVVNGAEITRMFPPGHINAVFIQDANKLLNIDRSKQSELDELLKDAPKNFIDEYTGNKWFNDAGLAALWPIEEALSEAKEQNAFVFWNHPVWSAETDNVETIVGDLNKYLFKENLVHGIEVVNGQWFSDEAFQIGLDYNLTLLGTSDIHGLTEWDYLNQPGGHRPLTLVLATDRTEESIKEALFDGRTVIWYKNDLIGLEKNLLPLLDKSLQITDITYKGRTIGNVELKNYTDVRFMLRVVDKSLIENSSNIIFVEPNESTVFELKYAKGNPISINVEVLNAYIKPKIHPIINLSY